MSLKYIFAASARYVAFGLSYDQIMNRDSVIECVDIGGSIRAFASFTTTYSSPRIQV